MGMGFTRPDGGQASSVDVVERVPSEAATRFRSQEDK